MSMDQCVWSHLTSAEQEQICLSKQINLSHSHLAKTHLFTLWQMEEPWELKAPLRISSHVCTQRWIRTVTEVWAAKTHSPTHGEPAIKQFTGSSYKTAGKQEEFISGEENASDHLYYQSSQQLCCASKYEREVLSDEGTFPDNWTTVKCEAGWKSLLKVEILEIISLFICFYENLGFFFLQ